MTGLVIAGGIGVLVGVGAAWVVGNETGVPLFLGGLALGVGGTLIYLKVQGA